MQSRNKKGNQIWDENILPYLGTHHKLFVDHKYKDPPDNDKVKKRYISKNGRYFKTEMEYGPLIPGEYPPKRKYNLAATDPANRRKQQTNQDSKPKVIISRIILNENKR